MGKLVLVVEDDPKNLKLVRYLLEANGYKTIEATDGRMGVESAIMNRPDLILMDIQMPYMDGIEATRILKAHPETKDIPIVALTSYVMEGDEERIMKAGFEWYISKPIDTREFIKKVEGLLAD